MIRKLLAFTMSLTLILSGCGQGTLSNPAGNGNSNSTPPVVITPTTASAAIKHVVVIFGENISFDHYFGTYPNAVNPPGEPQFTAAADTPTPNNYVSNPSLLTQNPNLATNAVVTAERRTLRQTPSVWPAPRPGPPARTTTIRTSSRPSMAARWISFPLNVGTANSATQTAATGAPALAQHQIPHHGLLRWQHRHRPVELRPALRHERPLVQHHLRPLHSWSPQPHLRPDQRRHQHHQPRQRSRGRRIWRAHRYWRR